MAETRAKRKVQRDRELVKQEKEEKEREDRAKAKEKGKGKGKEKEEKGKGKAQAEVDSDDSDDSDDSSDSDDNDNHGHHVYEYYGHEPSLPSKRNRSQDASTKSHLVEAWKYHRQMGSQFSKYYHGFADQRYWTRFRPGQKGLNLSILHSCIYAWAYKFVLSPRECADLTESQKRAIIASLEGQCVQEEWDTLHRLCPSQMCHNFHMLFLEALVIRDIYNAAIEKPFWYFDGKLNKEDEEGLADFGARMQYLFERFARTNEMRAATWLMETTRLANAVNPLQGHNLELGQHHEARRNDAVIGFSKSTLESEPVKFLLKKLSTPEEEEERLTGLVMAYRQAARCLTDNLQIHRGILRLRRSFTDIGEAYSDTSSVADVNCLNVRPENNYETTMLNGRRILLITHPCVLTRMSRTDGATCAVDSKAVVVVEDPDGESKDNPQRSCEEAPSFW